MTEPVTVVCDGAIYGGWQQVTIRYGASEAVRSATLVIPAPPPEVATWPIRAGAAVRILAGGSLLIDGYVGSREWEVDDQTARVSVEIQSAAIDLVQCSPDHPTGEIRARTLSQVAEALDTYGVGVTGSVGGAIPLVRIEPGETVFSTLERHARALGALLIGTARGIRLARGTIGRHEGPLVLGDRVAGLRMLRARNSESMSERYSETRVKGQSHEASGARMRALEVEARDTGVRRKRLRIVLHEGGATAESMRGRAAYEAQRRAGAGKRLSVELATWRDLAGRVWEGGYVVPVEAPEVGCVQDMAIDSVTLTLDTDQVRASLELVDPRGLGGEGASGGEYGLPGRIDTGVDDGDVVGR